MNIKRHIPNLITCGNLFCGCLAIVCAFNGDLVWAAYLVGIAAVLDFFDGFAARLLKVGGEMGKQLDSMADMVTFGVVPGVMMYKLIGLSISLSDYGKEPCEIYGSTWIYCVGFLITIFSAVRLAKFNIDTRQTNSFIGVPTPANSILICSIPLILYYNFHFIPVQDSSALNNSEHTLGEYAINKNSLTFFILDIKSLLILTILMSYLLVAELPLFALKFKNFGWADNKIRYSFLIISVILLILFQFIAIPFIIFLYIVLSIINNMMHKTKTLEH